MKRRIANHSSTYNKPLVHAVLRKIHQQWKLTCLLIAIFMLGNVFLMLFLPQARLTMLETKGSRLTDLKLMRWIKFGSPLPHEEFNSSSIGIEVIRKPLPGNDVSMQTVSRFDLELFMETGDAPNTKLPHNEVIILSAVARNTSGSDGWDVIAVNVWETSRLRDSVTLCCLLYNNSQLLETQAIDKTVFLNSSLASVQITCSNTFLNDKIQNDVHVPIGVTLSYHTSCPKDTASYVRPVYPGRCADDFCMAVCTKVAYGNINPNLIVEWMEYYKYMRVNRVVTFTYNLTSAASKVLTFYQQKGFVELHQFDFPRKDAPHHTVGDKGLESWTDEQMTVFDCQDRLRAYQYIGVFDLDEFLLPAADDNLQELMNSLKHRYPFSASFTFDTQIHATDWVDGVDPTQPMIPQFTQRSESMKDRPKVIHLPARVVPGGISSHGIWPLPGYKRTHLNESQAVLKHYRPCRTQYVGRDWCSNLTRHTDHTVESIFGQIGANIADAKQHIGI